MKSPLLLLALALAFTVSPASAAKEAVYRDLSFTKLEAIVAVRFVKELNHDPAAAAVTVMSHLTAGNMSLTLFVLDAVGYFFELEKMQFYASAGRWQAPENPQRDVLRTAYETEINLHAHGPYRGGILRDSFHTFSRELFRSMLAARGYEQFIADIRELLAGSRDYWHEAVMSGVIESADSVLTPAQASVLVNDIREGVFRNSVYPSKLEAIAQRPLSRSLMFALMSRLLAMEDSRGGDHLYGRIADASALEVCEKYLGAAAAEMHREIHGIRSDPGF